MFTSKQKRMVAAFAKKGMHLSVQGHVWTVKLLEDSNGPSADILLHPDLVLEGRAAKQLAQLAAVRHPDGGRVPAA